MEQTQSGLFVPAGTLDIARESSEDVLARQYAGMAKLEQHFPHFVKLAIGIARRIGNMANEKSLPIDAVNLGAVRWHHNGIIAIEVFVDPKAERLTSKDHAVLNYGTLREVNEKFPHAVSVVMALAFKLMPMINRQRVRPSQITVGEPRWPTTGTELTFTIKLDGKPLAAPLKIKL